MFLHQHAKDTLCPEESSLEEILESGFRRGCSWRIFTGVYVGGTHPLYDEKGACARDAPSLDRALRPKRSRWGAFPRREGLARRRGGALADSGPFGGLGLGTPSPPDLQQTRRDGPPQSQMECSPPNTETPLPGHGRREDGGFVTLATSQRDGRQAEGRPAAILWGDMPQIRGKGV